MVDPFQQEPPAMMGQEMLPGMEGMMPMEQMPMPQVDPMMDPQIQQILLAREELIAECSKYA